jgi:GNAT superfamily N-acetyltransferase
VNLSEIAVEPIEAPGDLDAFFRMLAATFVDGVPAEPAAADWRRYVCEAEPYYCGYARGVMREGTCIAGYLLEDRVMRVGAARLRAVCVVAVVTDAAYRHQGIGTAMMRDASAWAAKRGYALLFLHGRPNFYRPFGYVDVFDATHQAIGRADLLALPPSPYRVRAATPDDASDLLALYLRHHAAYAGSFERTLEQQSFHLRFAHSLRPSLYPLPEGIPYTVPLVALDASGRPRGYLYTPWGHKRALGWEAAADDWPATLALAQYHARMLEVVPGAAPSIVWLLPPDSLAFYHLADHLPVHSSRTEHPDAGWMVSLGDVQAAIGGLLPLWRERWRACIPPWTGQCGLSIGDRNWRLELTDGSVDLVDGPVASAHTIELSPCVLLQVAFGLRSLAWALAQFDQPVPPELVAALGVLFGPIQPWIAPSDGA